MNWYKQSEDTILRAAIARQELLMAALDIPFERTVQRKLAKYVDRAASAAGDDTQFSLNMALEGIDQDLLASYTAQYRRTGGEFSRAFFASIQKSLAQAETKDETDIFKTLLDAWIEENAAARVQLVTETTRALIQGAIAEAVNESLGPHGMQQLIRERAGGVINAQRAKVIARTETHTAAQFANSAAAEASGVELRKIWVSTTDERTRETHRKAERDSRATIIRLGEKFSVGGHPAMYPGDPALPAAESVNCFHPDTEVRGFVTAASKAVYSGDMVTIETLGTRKLSVTPNHPIMTPGGFKAAGDIAKGDNLFADRGAQEPSVLAMDKNRMPANIREVFGALGDLLPTYSRNATAVDFYGDAEGIQSNIDIVAVDGFLKRCVQTHGDRGLKEFSLVQADVVLRDFMCFSLSDLFFIGNDPTLGSGISCGNLLANGIRSLSFDALPLLAFRIGLISPVHSVLMENSRYHTAVTTEALGDLMFRNARQIKSDDICRLDVDSRHSAHSDSGSHQPSAHSGIGQAKNVSHFARGHSGIVEIDSVVNVERFHYDGPVLDVETYSGYTLAQGLIVSNCRCGLVHRPLILEE